MDNGAEVKVVCCICKKVTKPGPEDKVSHGYCEPCSTKMLWNGGLSQDEITDFINKHEEVQT